MGIWRLDALWLRVSVRLPSNSCSGAIRLLKLIEATLTKIHEQMRSLFAGKLPDRYLVVRGYKGIHPILLEYLAQHVGQPVRSSKLRVLTGDQTHTERRVRDLRDLGFAVEWKKVADDDQYELRSVQPDLDKAARLHVKRNINSDRTLSAQEKTKLLALTESSSGLWSHRT
jgi:hypothetical protein